MDTIGTRIRAARINAGILNGCEFARSLDISESTLWVYENDRQTPRIERLAKIATATGVSIDWLVTGKGKGPSSSQTDEVV